MTKYDFTCIDLKDEIKDRRNIDQNICYFHKDVYYYSYLIVHSNDKISVTK